jgi:multiple sugar transport system substrate-binding protein
LKTSVIPFLTFCLMLMSLPASGAGDNVSFWTTEVEKDRLEVQRRIARSFNLKTGISVHVIPVQENLLTARVTAAFAARSLPDVIFHPLDFTMGWTKEGILDTAAATEVLRDLGRDTFWNTSMNLIRVPSGYAAVPVDGWGQLLLYRKDLFEARGLPAPDCWESILKAAQSLHQPPLIWGFEAATDPGDIYTQQIFEAFALSNGVRLIGPSGKVDLDTPGMVQTLNFYKTLCRFTPPGSLNWLHTRLDYLSGRAAMVIWSPFILDELSGLRQDQPVVPDISRQEKGYLARNTGFVSIIRGPNGSAQYGQINCLGITRDARSAAAKSWVKFLLTEGYLDWLGMAAEGKLPVRKGTHEAPARFIDGWMDLEFGARTRARISRFYGMDVAETIIASLDGIDRWGFARGKGALVSKIYGTKVLPEILKRFLDDELSADQAARMLDRRVKALER